jgi:hypothetical protein
MTPRLDTIKRISITIRCTTEMRHTLETNWSNIGRMGSRPMPEEPMLGALQELGRLAAYFGHYDAARTALAEGLKHGAGLRAAEERKQMTPAERTRHDLNMAAYHGGEGDPD